MDNGLYQEKVIALLVNIQDAVRIIALAVLAIVEIGRAHV